MTISLNYEPDGETLRRYMASEAFVRIVQGPIGSGKTVASCIEMLKLMLLQEPTIDQKTGKRTGPRLVRIGVIRNTTPQLETTTMNTWLEWMPEHEFGKVRWRAPYRQKIEIPMPDGSPVLAEVWFLALDRDEDIKKLLSFEFTFLFINEAREISHPIFTNAISRLRRYPGVRLGGPTRTCMIADTNAPAEDHWLSIMSGQVPFPEHMSLEDRVSLEKPKGWEFFLQPPAMLDDLGPGGELIGYRLNPDRENARWTDEQYYTELIHGQTRDWIMNMVQNKIGQLFSGRPVYSGFNETVHIAREPIEPEEGLPITVGIDFGLSPAAVFMQNVHGQVRVFHEIIRKDTHAQQMAETIAQDIQNKWPNFRYQFVGDPAGEARAGTDGRSPYQIYKARGLDVKPAWTNDPIIRIGAVQQLFNTMVDGMPCYLLSPRCTGLIAGKRGGYCYKRDAEEIDKKNRHTHSADAEQYGVLKLGFGQQLIGRTPGQKSSVQAKTRQNVFAARGMALHNRRSDRMLSRFGR